MFAGKVGSFGEMSSLDSGLGVSALDTVLFVRPPQLIREMVSWLDTISGSVFFFFSCCCCCCSRQVSLKVMVATMFPNRIRIDASKELSLMKDAFYEKILNYHSMNMLWVHDAKGSCSGSSFGKLITVEKVPGDELLT